MKEMNSESNYKKIFSTWYEVLKPIVYTEKFDDMLEYLKKKYKSKSCNIYPKSKTVFSPFKTTSYDSMHTCILYSRKMFKKSENGIGFGQLDNSIYTSIEIELFYKCIEKVSDRGFIFNADITLEHLSNQGFLFLNTSLTSEQFNVRMHKKFWTKFLIMFFRILSANKSNINYILIGSEAWKFSKYISSKNSYVFKVEQFSVAENQLRDWNFDFRIIDTLVKNNHNKLIQWEKI